jgi:putative membrane protein
MKDLTQHFLSDSDRAAIEACVRRAELSTRAEIVVLAVSSSHHYPAAALLAAAAFSFPAAIAAAMLLGELLWLKTDNLWLFLAVLLPLLFAGREAVRRLPGIQRLFISQTEMDAEVREAAVVQFHRRGLHRTRERNGVLLYLSVFERRVRVLADRGISERIPEGFWQEAVDEAVAGIREGRPADAVCRCVERIARVLAEQFPMKPGDTDELANLLVGK